jgi:hypothetical protein
MIDKRMLERELRQARQARMELQAAEIDIEDMREDMRRTQQAWRQLGLIESGTDVLAPEQPALRAA